MLHDIFASRYPSVKGAKVVVDSSIGRPKGYGFVKFGDENDRSQALPEMNGVCCSSRPMRVGVATPKKPSVQQQYSSQAWYFLVDMHQMMLCPKVSQIVIRLTRQYLWED
ncbi:polyadenylate-binding protein RBP47-like [Primulina tabacum]|uniref:polyadenylate-binding protein RBP47-like n=1 Tax=Primulina tabacum TaxID=48773 RepID=UPI003F5924F6